MTEAAELNENNNVKRKNSAPLRVLGTDIHAAFKCYATLCSNLATVAPVIKPLWGYSHHACCLQEA